MLKNYFKVAWRHLLKNKAFSFINIAGLTIGMSCTMLLLLWVYNERSWNKYNENYNEIYHVLSNRTFNDEIVTGPDMMYPLAKAAKAKFPEISSAAVVSFGENTLFTVGDKKINKRTLTATADLFDIFTFDFVQGTANAINDPDAVILNESTARALFNSDQVIGKPVRINNERTAYVKAVVKDLPPNSTLEFEGIIPFNPSSPQVKELENEWVNCNNRVFVKTVPGANIATLEQKVLNLIKDHTESENPTTRGNILFHPMSKWRLYEEFENGENVGGRIEYVNLFTWVAIIILAIACINFMNLSTASAGKRAREVGIRKTLGSERGQLLGQFIAESVLLSVIAFVFAVALVYLSVPAFSQLLNIYIKVPFLEPVFWLIALLIITVTGIVAGSYPAFYLSGFNPIKVLKGTFLPTSRVLLPRKALVVSQFIVSAVLISATLIIYQQIQYVKNRDIGYNPDKLVRVQSSAETDKHFSALKNDLLSTGLVSAVARSSSPVTTIFGYTSGIRWHGAPEGKNLVVAFLFANEDFAKTLNVKLLSGRDFQAGDTSKVILNEEAVKTMGLKSPVGMEIQWAGRTRTIIGVIDNMVMLSPYEAPTPVMINYENKWSGNLNIRLAEHADVRQSLSSIESIYKKYSPSYPFEYKFVDDEFNEKFETENRIGKLSVVFAGLAIFICCLGLYGLVSFSIEKRTKEIGVRRVLGASVQQLLLLMSKEFLVLIAIAFLVAIPIVWWGMNDWLQNYTYRITINLWLFSLVGIVILSLTLITVCLNAFKSAIANPVKNLRTE